MSQKPDHFNRSGLIAFVFSVSFSLLFMGYLAFFHPGARIDKVKEKADQATGALAEKKEQEKKSNFDPAAVSKPWETSDDLVAYGGKLFAMNCVACHGKEGKGDGPAAAGIVPPPRNLVLGNWKKGGKSKELFETLSNGISGTSMASFAHLSVVDRWSLVHFIRSITQNKTVDNLPELEKFAATAK